MSLGENIKRFRAVAGLRTQKELAELLGIPQPRVSDWENDRYGVLGISSLVRLASVFRCSVDVLLAGVDAEYDRLVEGGARDAVPAVIRPDIAVVAEGDGFPYGVATRDERPRGRPQVLRWLSRPGDLGDPQAYGVEIRGDSMLPAYRPNMIAIVSPALEVRDGDEVYGQLASGERVVRLLYKCSDGYILQPYNPVHSARVVRKGEIEALHAIVYSRACNRQPRALCAASSRR